MSKESTESTEKQGKHYKVDIRKVRPLERAGGNIRTEYGDIVELAKSIAINGVISPLRGFRVSDDSDFEWESIDGHRRTKACKLLIEEGVKIGDVLYKPETVFVPIMTVDARSYSDAQIVVDMVTTASGKELTPLELSTAIVRLTQSNWTPKEIGEKLSMTTHKVRNLILLGSAPKRVRDLVSENKISYTIALDFLRDSIDFNDAIDKIEKALSKVSSNPTSSGKKEGRITNRDHHEATNKVDSFFELKKVFKKQVDNPKSVINNDLYFFAKMIIENKYTSEDIEKRFFN